MLIHVESIQEFEELASAMGYVKGSDGAVGADKTPAKGKTSTKKVPPKKEAEAPKTSPEKTDVKGDAAPATQADVLEYVKANMSDNIQGIKDMLASVGAAKISEIPDESCDKALSLLKGE